MLVLWFFWSSLHLLMKLTNRLLLLVDAVSQIQQYMYNVVVYVGTIIVWVVNCNDEIKWCVGTMCYRRRWSIYNKDKKKWYVPILQRLSWMLLLLYFKSIRWTTNSASACFCFSNSAIIYQNETVTHLIYSLLRVWNKDLRFQTNNDGTSVRSLLM
jgi:hypothetical protein